jgi:hypothetical protein
MNANGKKAEGNREKGGFLQGREYSKHVFLRNEPDLKTVIYKCNSLGGKELRRANKLLQSGSFGAPQSSPTAPTPLN